LYRKDWTFEQNDAVFGKCFTGKGYSHVGIIISELIDLVFKNYIVWSSRK
jgi:hypothetical protein